MVGRVYRTTPRCLDDLRDMVSLSAEAIDSYQLGTHHVVVDGTRRATYVRVDEEADALQQAEAAAHAPQAQGGGAAGGDVANAGAMCAALEALETQMYKVENMLLLQHERLEALEQAGATAGKAENGGGGGKSGGGGKRRR